MTDFNSLTHGLMAEQTKHFRNT